MNLEDGMEATLVPMSLAAITTLAGGYREYEYDGLFSYTREYGCKGRGKYGYA